jgi:hypothetical protein
MENMEFPAIKPIHRYEHDHNDGIADKFDGKIRLIDGIDEGAYHHIGQQPQNLNFNDTADANFSEIKKDNHPDRKHDVHEIGIAYHNRHVKKNYVEDKPCHHDRRESINQHPVFQRIEFFLI